MRPWRWLLFIGMWWGLVGCGVSLPSAPERCDDNGYLLIDDFSGERDCGWAEYNRGGAVVAIGSGGLHITSSQPGQIWWTNPGRNFEDVVIQVTTRQTDGPDDNAYGLICRYQSPENFYLFLISSDGYYAIGKYQSGNNQITYLSGEGEYQPSDVINQGEATNDIEARCEGDTLSLAVNGIELETVRDGTFVTGDVGMAVSTFEAGVVDIQFDDFMVFDAAGPMPEPTVVVTAEAGSQ